MQHAGLYQAATGMSMGAMSDLATLMPLARRGEREI